VRRLVAAVVLISLATAGLTVAEPVAARALPTAQAEAHTTVAQASGPQTWGTITGTVSFATAPSWDKKPTDRTFTVELMNDKFRTVNTSTVPVSYSYIGANGFSISFPNSESYYNDYFNLDHPYTVRIEPNNPIYPTTYLGGGVSREAATQVTLPLASSTSQTDVGNTAVALAATISGTLTVPDGIPAGGIQAVAMPTAKDEFGSIWPITVDVGSNGSYHLFPLRAADYNVAFVPKGEAAGPGAGVWWKSKASLTGATVVTLAASEQRTGVNQSLPKGGVVTGILKDSQGRLVHGGGGVAIYSTAGTEDSRETLVQQTWVKEDGSYQFWGLPIGTYKIGFDTGTYEASPSALSMTNLDGSALPARILPTVDLAGFGAADPAGRLAKSTYPYTSAWYSASAASFATAKSVAVSSSGQIVSNINGILPIDAAFTAWQTDERTTGSNLSEKLASCACGDPIDTFSGEYSESTVDLALPGAGVPVQVDRTYAASLAGTDGPFGLGSSSTLNAKLVTVPGSETNQMGGVVVTQENGSTVTFTRSGQNDYFAPARVNATLTFDYWRDQWEFTRNATDMFRFSSTGGIVSHRDLHGNTVTFGADGAGIITSISGSGDRLIALDWGDGHVSSASDSAGRTVSYAYNGKAELTSVTGVDGRVLSFDYDAAHHVVSETRPGGGILTNVYDAEGRVTTQTDPMGRVTTLAYAGTSADSTTTVTDPAGAASTFHYLDGRLESHTQAAGTTSAATSKYIFNAALDIVKKTDPLGKSTTMTYDNAGNMLTSTDPLGHTSSFAYNNLHNVISSTDALNRATTAVFDASGQKISATSPSGATTTWQYNADGTVSTTTDPAGATTSYGYDAAGRMTAAQDPLGRIEQTGFDPAGHPISATNASGAVTSATVDALGRVLASTDELGQITSYTYDAAGYQTSATKPDGSITSVTYNLNNEIVTTTDALGNTTALTYTALGKIATSTNPNGAVITTGYDVLGRPTSVTDPKNLKTTTTYDKNGRVTQVRSPAGHISKIAYDAAGRKISSADPSGNVTTLTYDIADQLTAVKDPLDRTTGTSFDADGRPTTITGPDGHLETVVYDAVGRQTGYTDADGNSTAYTYDSAGQRTSRIAPGGLTTSYEFDASGRVILVTKPDGATISSRYDDAGHLLATTPSIGIGMTATYDELGRRTTMTDSTGTTRYAYSLTGQPTEITNGAGLSVGYRYDPAGQNTQLIYPGGKKVSYIFDLDGRMTSLTDWAGRKTSFTWTPDSLLSKQTSPNKVTSTFIYDANNRTKSITVASTATPTTALGSYQYGYDAASQLTSTLFADPLHTASGGNPTSYGYDQRGQLTVTGTTGSYSTTPSGHIVSTPAGAALSYNPAQQLTASVNATAQTRSDYRYDGNGNRTEEVSTTPSGPGPATVLGYNQDNALVAVSASNETIEYTADGDGVRQSRTSGTTTDKFVWDVNTSIPMLLDDGTARYIYGPALTPVAQVDASGTIEYLHSDNVGSVRIITDSTGDAIGVNEYSPYGAVSAHEGVATSNFGYATAWIDPDTALAYLRARDYDARTGQFVQADPAVDSTRQPYAYVGGDPLASTDPTGLCTFDTPQSYCGYSTAPPSAKAIQQALDAAKVECEQDELQAWSYSQMNGLQRFATDVFGWVKPGLPLLAMGVGTRGSTSGGAGKGPTVELEARPYLTPGSRPSYRNGVVDEVWNNAKGPDGTVRDPNTFEELHWTPGTSRAGQWDMGHVPGQKYNERWSEYVDGKYSPQEFRDWYNNPDHYRPELPSNNRSHEYE
jgi:RHS repeat-associated protein